MKFITLKGMQCWVSTKQHCYVHRKRQHKHQSLWRLRKQRIAGLRRTLCSLATQPYLYISLMIPGACCDTQRFTNCMDVFTVFVRKLVYRFSDCWFVYKREWTKRTGFHFHLMGNLFTSRWLNFNTSKHEEVSQLWNASITEVHGTVPPVDAKPCLVKKCRFEMHTGYLLKNDKEKQDMAFIKKSGGAQTWNFINKKNILFAPKVSAEISEKAYYLFLDKLKEELDGTGFNTEYIVRIRPKGCASLSYIDNDILLRAIKEACEEAHDGSAVYDI